MSEKLYISPSLYYYDNKLFHDAEKPILLNSKNWSKYLEEYGYEKISKKWNNRLCEKYKNSLYGVIDCGSNGDCLFHCIAEALHDKTDIDNEKLSIEILRQKASEKVDDNNFDIILENYKCEIETNVFEGLWDPSTIKSKDELREEMCKCGDSFWGDHIILQLLQEAFKFNTIIFNSGEYDNNFTIHPLCSLEKYDDTILLYYQEGYHFQLLGYFIDNKMKTVFKRHELPKKLIEIYNIDCHNLD